MYPYTVFAPNETAAVLRVYSFNDAGGGAEADVAQTAPRFPFAGGGFDTTVYVQNAGTAPTPGGLTLTAWSNASTAQPDCGEVGEATMDIPPLQPGKLFKAVFRGIKGPEQAGRATFRAFADNHCVLLESGPVRNTLDAPYEVTSKPMPTLWACLRGRASGTRSRPPPRRLRWVLGLRGQGERGY